MSEGAALAGAAVLYTLLAMWATQPPSTCTRPFEPGRSLDLQRDVDREHLARDADEIARVAHRYAAHLNATTADPADAAVQQCEDTLARDVAVVHHVTFDQIRGAIAAER